MDINLNDLTIGELEEVEEISGTPFASLGEGNMTIKAVKAIVFVTKRRENPAFTLEDAAKIRIAEFTVSAETDPTSAAT